MKLVDALNPVLRDIRHFFGFLYNRGFDIQQSQVGMFWPPNWVVIFSSEAEQCLIKIWSDRDTIYLAFGTNHAPFDNRMGLEPIIYYLSQGETFPGMFEGNAHDRKGQLARLSVLLKEHIDQILPYFRPAVFPKYHDELLLAQQQYLEIFMKKYVPYWRSTS